MVMIPSGFVIYPLVTTALYYLGAWALVTRWLWSRYPDGLFQLMHCAACSGFWYGLAVGIIGRQLGIDFPGGHYAPVVAALCSMVWTPVVARQMLYDINALGLVSTPSLGEPIEVPEPAIRVDNRFPHDEDASPFAHLEDDEDA